MIVTTAIDLSSETYRYFMNAAMDIPDMTTEELMAIALTLYISMRQLRLPMSKMEWDNMDRLLRDGTLKHLL